MFDDGKTDQLARVVKEKEGVKKELNSAQEAVLMLTTHVLFELDFFSSFSFS